MEFTCETVKQCIDLSQVCNQVQDCQDGSDEKNCACQELIHWTCQDGTCVDKEYRCDGDVQVLERRNIRVRQSRLSLKLKPVRMLKCLIGISIFGSDLDFQLIINYKYCTCCIYCSSWVDIRQHCLNFFDN